MTETIKIPVPEVETYEIKLKRVAEDISKLLEKEGMTFDVQINPQIKIIPIVPANENPTA